LYLLQDNRIETNFDFSIALAHQGNSAKMTCKFLGDTCLSCVMSVLQTDRRRVLHVHHGTRVLGSTHNTPWTCIFLSAIMPPWWKSSDPFRS